mmetsp:Transcript_6714/g.22026  ORF Transcript_6714/g.22026 Transcript_6714/m.22026 type:complete len:582 (-) Transcript_6714:1266-3011(-)
MERPIDGEGAHAPSATATAHSSRTSTTTVIGRHEHVISGYSLLKGLGDGEPIASDRFMVGGHEWVLLFYPDGKRSMSDGNAPNVPAEDPYAALFVALIGEGHRPLGVVQSSSGRVVRAFHRFTLVDQSGNNRHITKGRQREQGAVKISCARQDPTARNCHGYRKFVRRSVLEASGSGYLVNDVIVIRYEIELVVTSGGALNKNTKLIPSASVNVPNYPTIGKNLIKLLYDEKGAFDVTFDVDGEIFNAHKLILSSRSSVFKGMFRTGAAMREGAQGVCKLLDIDKNVFKLLLHFVYADELPALLKGDDTAGLDDLDFTGTALAAADGQRHASGHPSDKVPFDVSTTQHLLVAADRFDLSRLRAMCEARLCESVDIDSVANTLTLAELNHADALRRACLSFIAANLSDVMSTAGYDAMNRACPHLAGEILQAVAELKDARQAANLAAAAEARAPSVPALPPPATVDETPRRRGEDANANNTNGGNAEAARGVMNLNIPPAMSAFSNFLVTRAAQRFQGAEGEPRAQLVPQQPQTTAPSGVEEVAGAFALDAPDGIVGADDELPSLDDGDGEEDGRRVRPRRG